MKEVFTMAYVINDSCIQCGSCAGQCPVGAISEGDGKFEINADPFYSAENIAELERRVANLRNGSSVLKEHELIEVDDE